MQEGGRHLSSKTSGWVAFVVAVLVAAGDQLSKHFIRQSLSLYQSIPVIPKVLYITHTTNTGIAFGLLQNRQSFVILASLVALVIVFLFVFRFLRDSLLASFALGLILGGAIGNLVDRVYFGQVTDFIDFRVWPAFNVADSCVVAGFGLLVLFLFRQLFKKPQEQGVAAKESKASRPRGCPK